MCEEDWQQGFGKSIGVFLNGEAIPSPGPMGERIVDDSFYLLFNAHHEQLPFVLLSREGGWTWAKVLDTAEMVSGVEPQLYQPGEALPVYARSLIVMRLVPGSRPSNLARPLAASPASQVIELRK
jgi:isoamylase